MASSAYLFRRQGTSGTVNFLDLGTAAATLSQHNKSSEENIDLQARHYLDFFGDPYEYDLYLLKYGNQSTTCRGEMTKTKKPDMRKCALRGILSKSRVSHHDPEKPCLLARTATARY